MRPLIIYLFVSYVSLPLVAQSSLNTVECSCKSNAIKLVTIEDPKEVIQTNISINGDPEWNNKNPVLATTIKSRKGCIIVNFSAEIDPTDNFAVFQVQVDGQPMKGHFLSDNIFLGQENINLFPLSARMIVAETDEKDSMDRIVDGLHLYNVIDADQKNKIVKYVNARSIPRTIAQTFFVEIGKGLHTIELFYAGCCGGSGNPGQESVFLRAPTLAIQYRK